MAGKPLPTSFDAGVPLREYRVAGGPENSEHGLGDAAGIVLGE
jgi:hypothetical protein